MSLKLEYKCFKHPRYNPVAQGEQGIRGACKDCARLLEAYIAVCRVMRENET